MVSFYAAAVMFVLLAMAAYFLFSRADKCQVCETIRAVIIPKRDSKTGRTLGITESTPTAKGGASRREEDDRADMERLLRTPTYPVISQAEAN